MIQVAKGKAVSSITANGYTLHLKHNDGAKHPTRNQIRKLAEFLSFSVSNSHERDQLEKLARRLNLTRSNMTVIDHAKDRSLESSSKLLGD